MSEVVVVIGAGLIGQAIARRVSAGKHVVLSDLHQENADAAADVLSNAGFDVSTVTVDVSSRHSIHDLVETARSLARLRASSMQRASRPARPRRRPSSPLICMAPQWCSRNSGTSLRAAGPGS